jgi:signal transduction histidine kinase
MSVYFATVFPAAAFLCGRTVWKAHRRGDHGSRLFFAGILVLIASGIHDDLMYRYAFSNFPLIGWGVVSFSLIQSYFISARFSQAFTRAETSEAEVRALNRNLEGIIEEKTRDIRSIMENIPLAVFMFESQGYRIHKDYSQHSKRIFARPDLNGVNALDLLFDQSQLSSDQKDQARSAVENSLDQDRMNFDVNAHCLPHEIIRKNKKGEESILELSWSPMENAAKSVERLLVTLRDVTDLRHLQRKAQEQNDVLEVLAEILNVAPQRFVNFLLDARETMSQCETLLQKALVNELFISLHTLKGSARSLPLKRLTDVVHQAEQILVEERGRTWDPNVLQKLQTAVESVREAIALYSRVAQDMLNRSLSPEPLLAPSRSSRLEDVLTDITACLPMLAEDLGKAKPRLTIETPDLYVTTEGERLLHHVFTHILRNAMDHGLEKPEERQRQGKDAEGRLEIRVIDAADHIQLSVSDDGRGLALNRLRQLGREHGFSDKDLRDDERVAALIFQSGYSTATELSEVSGRGVGMSAIQRFVEQCGGEVQLRLDPHHQGEAFRNFTLEIRLPRGLFQVKQNLSGVA